MERKQNINNNKASLAMTPETLHSYADCLGFANYRFQFGPCVIEVKGTFDNAKKYALKAAEALGFTDVELLPRS